MSREADNVALVRSFYERFNSGGRNAALDFLSPDIEMETDPRHPSAGVYRGVEQYRAFMEEFEEPYEQSFLEPERYFAKGDQVVVYVRTRRRPHGSSIEVENRIGFLWIVRDGKLVREQAFGEREKALAAAGLDEGDAIEGKS
jgi:ketosteroid isomerase-like protein